tara:strand:- start:4528 stop:5355 length:828 start_codon:yes stop_codon:yes gene_type:complete
MNYKRILEPILLGSSANLIINIIFDPTNPYGWWSISEFIIAILFCVPITEMNRFIERKLESKFKSANPNKLFLYQLLLLSFVMLLILNVIGRLYHWLIYDGFYESGEIIVINLIVFAISFLLVFYKWSKRFYTKWKSTELHLEKSNIELDKMSSKLQKSNQILILKKLNEDFSIKAQDVRLAIIEYGNVKVYTFDYEFYIFSGTLNELVLLLPENSFFQATRNVVVHRDVIVSISAATYGKVLLKVDNKLLASEEITVSRPKASVFRKWYHTTST